MKETDLSQPVVDFLVKNGYEVNTEVKNCDIIARKDEDIIAIELKIRFNATLLIQAVERQKFADSVYIAILRPENRHRMKNWRGMVSLLKRLGIGLILVSILKTRDRVDVLFHPDSRKIRKSPRKRNAIIRELDKRTGNYNTAGSSRRKIITAYRENAIFIACCLKKFGELSPRELRALGTGEKTSSILQKDHFGWFERVERGIYRLHENGLKALHNYQEITKIYIEKLDKIPK